MRVMLTTANLDRFERKVPWVTQDLPDLSLHVFTSRNFPRRENMSPRFQARICKILGWQFFPGYDRYLWVDSQFALLRPDSARWLLDQLGDHEIVFYRHPTRKSIRMEAEWIAVNLPHSQRLQKRYTGELWQEQLAVIESDPGFKDTRLFAGGIYAARLTDRVRAMCLEWWYHVSRYHINDQLSLPYALWKQGVDVGTIDANIFESPYFTWTRGRTRG